MAIRTEDARYEQPKIQFYGISFLRPYKQSGRWQDVLDTYGHNKIPIII